LLVTPSACPQRKHLKGNPIGFALALASNSKTQLKRVTKGKPSSLLGLVIIDEGKKFYSIDTCCQCFKTFFPRCRCPAISWSVCNWQIFFTSQMFASKLIDYRWVWVTYVVALLALIRVIQKTCHGQTL
jgi:hypothetical protein